MKKKNFDVLKLQEEYLEDGISILALSKKYNCGESTINNYLKTIYNEQVLQKMKHRKYGINSYKKEKSICLKDGCNNIAKSCEYCLKHYNEIVRQDYLIDNVVFDSDKIIYETEYRNNINTYFEYGNHIEIVIYNKKYKKYTIVEISKNQFQKIQEYVWRLNSNAYISTKTNYKELLLHRFIMNATSEDYVDHIDRKRNNCRDYNLRLVNYSENGVNKSTQANNTSGVVGVTWDKSREKWKVTLNIYNKCYNVGRYIDFEEAVEARLQAEKKYHNKFTPIERQMN